MSWERLLNEARIHGSDTQPPMQWDQSLWDRWLKPPRGSLDAYDAFQTIQGKYKNTGLTRAEVKQLADIARKDRNQAVMNFLIALLLWGYADTDSRGPYRVAKMTQSPGTVHKILDVIDSLEDEGVKKAYSLL